MTMPDSYARHHDSRRDSVIEYPDTEELFPTEHVNIGHTVEREYPGHHFTRDTGKVSELSQEWGTMTYGIGTQPITVRNPNPKRYRLVIWTDSNSGGGVNPLFITDGSSNGGAGGIGDGSVSLAPNCDPVYLYHTGKLVAFCPTGDGILCIIEENYK